MEKQARSIFDQILGDITQQNTIESITKQISYHSSRLSILQMNGINSPEADLEVSRLSQILSDLTTQLAKLTIPVLPQ
jgi:hypothetical protein